MFSAAHSLGRYTYKSLALKQCALEDCVLDVDKAFLLSIVVHRQFVLMACSLPFISYKV